MRGRLWRKLASDSRGIMRSLSARSFRIRKYFHKKPQEKFLKSSSAHTESEDFFCKFKHYSSNISCQVPFNKKPVAHYLLWRFLSISNYIVWPMCLDANDFYTVISVQLTLMWSKNCKAFILFGLFNRVRPPRGYLIKRLIIRTLKPTGPVHYIAHRAYFLPTHIQPVHCLIKAGIIKRTKSRNLYMPAHQKLCWKSRNLWLRTWGTSTRHKQALHWALHTVTVKFIWMKIFRIGEGSYFCSCWFLWSLWGAGLVCCEVWIFLPSSKVISRWNVYPTVQCTTPALSRTGRHYPHHRNDEGLGASGFSMWSDCRLSLTA